MRSGVIPAFFYLKLTLLVQERSRPMQGTRPVVKPRSSLHLLLLVTHTRLAEA